MTTEADIDRLLGDLRRLADAEHDRDQARRLASGSGAGPMPGHQRKAHTMSASVSESVRSANAGLLAPSRSMTPRTSRTPGAA